MADGIASTSVPPATPPIPNGAGQHQVELPHMEAAHDDDGEGQLAAAGRQAAAGDPPAGNHVRINIDPYPRQVDL